MKTRHVPSALPVYCAALCWVLFALLLPMYKLGWILLCAAVSVGVYLGAKRFFPGRTEEYEEAPNSGNKDVDQMILSGRRDIAALRSANADIPEPAVTEQLDRMEKAAGVIFAQMEKQPREALRVRRFLNYYLPTTVKLLTHYRELTGTGAAGENIDKSKKAIEESLSMIAEAFEKQADKLYGDEALDITTDIQVLETLMRSEGLADDVLARAETAQTADTAPGTSGEEGAPQGQTLSR